MKQITTLTIVLLLISSSIMAEQKAITSEGDEVILYDNGTWTYQNKVIKQNNKIPTNNNEFIRSQKATFLVKSKRNNSAFYINPKKWSFKKQDGEKEYFFELRNKGLYALAITEEVELGIEGLALAGYNNAKSAAPDARILKKEYRIVNGNKVIYMEMEGTMSGVKFTYLGYYYSNSSGSTQLITYTGSNLVKKYKSEILEFLNGLVTQEK